MTAIEYAESRLAELPLLWSGTGPHKWREVFGCPIPPAEERIVFILMGSSKYFHEYPGDRVLLYDGDSEMIYGLPPKPPINWAADGEALVKTLRDLVDDDIRTMESGDHGNYTLEDRPELSAAVELLTRLNR